MTRGGKAPLKDLLSKVIAQFNKMVTLKRHRVDSQRRALIYNLFLAMIFAAFCSRPFVIIFEVPIIICLFKTGLISSIINTIWHILGMMWFVKAEMPRVCASTSPSAIPICIVTNSQVWETNICFTLFSKPGPKRNKKHVQWLIEHLWDVFLQDCRKRSFKWNTMCQGRRAGRNVRGTKGRSCLLPFWPHLM